MESETQKFKTKYFYDDLCLVKCISQHEMPTYLWRERKAIFSNLTHQNTSHFIGQAKNNIYFRKAWCMHALLSTSSLHMVASFKTLFHTTLQTIFSAITFSVHSWQTIVQQPDSLEMNSQWWMYMEWK